MMVSDNGDNKPRDLFHKRVLKSYHRRQQIHQRMTTSSDEDQAGCGGFVPKKRFRAREINEPIDKSCKTESSSKSNSSNSSSSNVVVSTFEAPPEKEELKYGVISMIGRRRVMEDAITVALRVANNEFVFFAAYDGHGGSRVSHACRDRLHYFLEEELLQNKRKAKNNNNSNNNSNSSSSSVDWEKVMVKCFLKMDDDVMRDGNGVGGYEVGGLEEAEVGSTAVVVMVGKEDVVVANCGDCRVVLCNSGVAIPLSNDHKPDRPDEKKRVEDAGGKILNWNGSRVQGVLATSRSIGDHYLKPYVIPEPEVTVYKRNEWDEFLVIATDGLWDVVSNKVACEVVKKCLDGQIRRSFPERDCAAEAATLLAELAIAKGSKDNISVIVVELDKMSDIKVSL
ncbi:protein phosphatase 2C 51-like isoform X2 [Lycium ferocissimum]|uniref:protein phosphatase 2C 51-like isoform X2 n=1 Tax=Lycium ferocissimum TaxID=112874 RepID=UPI0028154C1E|nr:protein phosphatase 2C 51-like isoform X2 [Lycium ferocissimum]